MAKNKLLFSTPRRGVLLRPGETRVITRHHHHGEISGHDDKHHDDKHHDNKQDDNKQHDDKHHHHDDHDDDRRRGGIDVRDFEFIRVVANNRFSSETSVILNILTSTRNGRTLGRLARVRLLPGQSYTQSFVVPGRWVNIVAHAVRGCRGRGLDRIDVSVFGHK